MVNLGFNRISVWGKHTARVAEFVAAVAGPSNFNVIAPVPGILNNVREVRYLFEFNGQAKKYFRRS